jgi:hypothetical protein
MNKHGFFCPSQPELASMARQFIPQEKTVLPAPPDQAPLIPNEPKRPADSFVLKTKRR